MKGALFSILFILHPSAFILTLVRAIVFPLVAAAAAALALLFYVALLSRRKKTSSRHLRLVGRVASVERDLEPEGFVLVDGELWRARVRGGATVVPARAGVRVTGARGCVLEVEPLKVGPPG